MDPCQGEESYNLHHRVLRLPLSSWASSQAWCLLTYARVLEAIAACSQLGMMAKWASLVPGAARRACPRQRCNVCALRVGNRSELFRDAYDLTPHGPSIIQEDCVFWLLTTCASRSERFETASVRVLHVCPVKNWPALMAKCWIEPQHQFHNAAPWAFSLLLIYSSVFCDVLVHKWYASTLE